ncbi:competence protein CoiA [Peribacillus frigoritolerans]
MIRVTHKGKRGEILQRAINKFKEIVYAWEDVSDYKGNLFCPHCENEVTHRNGEKNRPHFSHKSLLDCPYSGYHESAEHIEMKLNLFNFLKEKYPTIKVELEKCLVSGRRADMVIQGKNQTLVVEFQASKISFEDIKERTKDYNKLGYPVLWIFHISRFGYKYFPSEEKYNTIPYELVKMHELDSIFVMNDKGFIKKCSLVSKKKNTKIVYKNKFLPVKMEFRFNKVVQMNNDEPLFLCQLGGNSIYSEKNLYYGYWLLKDNTLNKIGVKTIIFKLKDILPSNVFFKIKNVKYHQTHIEFQLFMENKSSLIKTDGLLITKEKMLIESVLARLKKPARPKPSPVKDESEVGMKEVAGASESTEIKSAVQMDLVRTEHKSVIQIQPETDSKENNLLKVLFKKIKNFFGTIEK